MSPDGALFFDILEESSDLTRVLWFLEQLLEEVEGRRMVIWDNGRIHRSVEVKTFLWEHRKRLETRRFPPSAPELDSDEKGWTGLKFQRWANRCPKTEERFAREWNGSYDRGGAPRAGRLLPPVVGVSAPRAP